MYNRYQGNSGRVERVAEPQSARRTVRSPLPPPDGPSPLPPQAAVKRPPGPLHDLRGSLGGLLSRLNPGKLQTEDLLVIAILYLMYRESGETELLIALGAFLFL
jgi:hypothetical protein